MTAASEQRRKITSALTLAGRVALHSVQKPDLPGLRGVPELAGELPADLQSDSLDHLAAAHYRLFGLNVFPYAAAFLDSSRLLGGPATQEARRAYAQAGFTPSTTAEAPDHLGHEWMFAAYLLDQGAEEQLGHFLHGHMLPWLLPLHLAVQRQGSPFFAAVTDFGLSQVEACLEEIPAPPTDPVFTFSKPPQDLLEDPETRLKDIAAFLLTPVHAGIYLSRDQIAVLGRQSRVPRGFGDRAGMLGNLLRTSVEYDTLDAVIALLRAEVDGWIAAYESFEGRPAFGPVARYWKARALETRQLLEKIGAAVG